MRDLSAVHHKYGSRFTRDNMQEILEGVQSVDRDGIVARINQFQTTTLNRPNIIESLAELPFVLSRRMEQPILFVH